METVSKKDTRRGCLILLAASFLWGTGIVAQKLGAGAVSAFTFNSMRMLVGLIIIIPAAFIYEKRERRRDPAWNGFAAKPLIIAAVIGGLGFFGGVTLQQMSLTYISAGKSGFINSLYIVFLPIAESLFHKKIAPRTWLGVAAALAGLYLLCIKEGFTLGYGDVLGIIGSFCWTFEIMVIDRYCNRVNPLALISVIVGVACICSFACAFTVDHMDLSSALAAWKPILYAGVVLVGICYTLQVFGQKTADPTLTGIIFSIEAVFSVLAGVLLLHETLTLREGMGCLLMLLALLITQVDWQALLQKISPGGKN